MRIASAILISMAVTAWSVAAIGQEAPDLSGASDVERLSERSFDPSYCDHSLLVTNVIKDLGHALQIEVVDLTSPAVPDAEERELVTAVENWLSMATIPATDGDLQIYLDKLLADLLPFTKRELDYRVVLVQDPMVNAFALPGGIIMMTTGLLDVAANEAQIVSVLAHEIGHHELRHVTGHLQLMQLLGLWDANALEETVLSTAANTVAVLQLPVQSRTEAAADVYAVDMIARLGYSPYQAAQLMLVFAQSEAAYRPDVDAGDSFASVFIPETINLTESHPGGQQRACAIRRQIELRYEDGDDPVFYVGEHNYRARVPRSETIF